MKKILILSVTVLFLVTGATAQIITESFTYDDGSLVPNGGWATHGRGTTGQIQVSSGAISLKMDGTVSEDVNRSFTSVTTGNIFASFDFSVSSSIGNFGSDTEYFAHFRLTSARGRIDIAGPTGSSGFSIGLSVDDASPDVFWGSDLSFDTTYTLVMSYHTQNDASELWIDPVDSYSTSITDTGGGSAQSVDKFAFRQSDSTSNETITIDNLIVGTSFNDVQAVPEPSTYALIFGGIALGVVILRRRFGSRTSDA